MCGFAGFIGGCAGLPDSEWHSILRSMGQAIVHRGPDDEGVWLDSSAAVGMAHRRLAILDLSAAGHQPMLSPSGRFVIAYNGEIYNHLDLRAVLDGSGGPAWRGHSDTETLLAAFEHWGIPETLRRTVGMFAIALWDRKEQELWLARDRLGEKPLYYGRQNGVLLFGSELKALQAHPSFAGRISREALTAFLRYNYVPTPFSIYEGISKLPPGSLARIRAGDNEIRPETYWSARNVVEQGIGDPYRGSATQAVAELDALIRQTLRGQMIADVPLGAFLSGGVDSSSVVSLMQQESTRPVRTFTIGFHEAGYDEVTHAKAVARHLGTDHTELYVTPDETRAVIPKLPELFDEPFADSSQIPTFLLSQLARPHVKVALSGDAGDELFGGYGRYFLLMDIWHNLNRWPRCFRTGAAAAIQALPTVIWDRVYRAARPIIPSRLRHPMFGDRMHKLADIFGARGPESIYLHLLSHWKDPAHVVLNGREPRTAPFDPATWPKCDSIEHWMMALDLVNYLPDDILVKVDRAAMGVSLETRVPFLDHRIVEFAFRLPLALKIRNGQGKHILRELLYCYVPKDMIARPKQGFSVPISVWLRGPLRDWAESLLDAARLRQEGWFDPQPIREKWVEHLDGRRNWAYYLWDILMFQAWYEGRRNHESA